ncbi:type I-F CRISPR-associated protein Csy3 [Salmonella enterica]|nr:type I-F CRISPR-associated protein Csy3 [Salmonella enterica]
MSTNLKMASSLSFTRHLSPSDAMMTAGNWDDVNNADAWRAVSVIEKSVRGVISNRLKAGVGSDPTKLKHQIEAANLQTVDAAALPIDCDTLRLAFTLRVLPGVEIPSVCNDVAVEAAITKAIKGYIEQTQMVELARRYAHNIASGRFLWRNRVGYEDLMVRVKADGEVFEFVEFEPGDFETESEQLDALSALIASSLAGSQSLLLHVEAFCRMGEGQEVFPSQELVLDTVSKKGKILYAVDGCAAMHSQKIGNALRAVDTWYNDYTTAGQGAISVEVYGSVTTRGLALRTPKSKTDFYSLFDDWICKGKVPSLEQQHFVVGNLIRGGLFGGKDEK